MPPAGPLEVATVPLSAVSASRLLFGRGCWLMGWSLIEPTGAAAASALFYEGSGTNGSVVGGFSIAQGTDSNQGFGPFGIVCDGGLFLDVLAGEVTGSVTVIASRSGD